MAAGDLGKTLGTPIKWLSTGGTYTHTWDSIATTNGAAGPKHTSALLYPEYELFFKAKTGGSAPAVGEYWSVYWCPSKSGTAATENAGKGGLITGVDQGLTAPTASQLSNFQFIGQITFGASAGTATEYCLYKRFLPRELYGTPVVVNNTGQTWTTTASEIELWITPIIFNVAQ